MRAFQSYSDKVTRENTTNLGRQIRGDQSREGFDSDKSDLDGNGADDFSDAGNQTPHTGSKPKNARSIFFQSRVDSTAHSACKKGRRLTESTRRPKRQH